MDWFSQEYYEAPQPLIPALEEPSDDATTEEEAGEYFFARGTRFRPEVEAAAKLEEWDYHLMLHNQMTARRLREDPVSRCGACEDEADPCDWCYANRRKVDYAAYRR